jgi:hypothetical protein
MHHWILLDMGDKTGTLQPVPDQTVPQTTDVKARVITVDRSYRMLKVMFDDGHVQEFKVPMPDTLENVCRGDDVLVRAGGVPVVPAKGA